MNPPQDTINLRPGSLWKSNVRNHLIVVMKQTNKSFSRGSEKFTTRVVVYYIFKAGRRGGIRALNENTFVGLYENVQ